MEAPVNGPDVEGAGAEIIVTARRRAETLLDVPLAVSVLSGEELNEAGIDDTEDLFGRVPGLYFTFAGGAAPTSDFTYLVLRGVGFNGGQEPSAGVFIDGMYQPQLGFDINFLDLERLEVLRGPQGTLFGRNTQGGALNLVTRKPGRDFEGRAEMEYGRFDRMRLFTGVRGPVSETLSAGFSAQYDRTDGFLTNSITGDDLNPNEQINFRGTVRFQPSTDIDIAFVGDLSRREGNEIGVGVPFLCECYVGAADNDREDEKDNDGLQLNVDWTVAPSVTLTSITGWRQVDSDVTIDFDASPTDQTPATLNGRPGSRVAPGPITVAGISQRVEVEQEFWSQELRLAGTVSAIDWLIGGYYFGQDQRQKRAFDIGPGVTANPAVAVLRPLTIREDFTTDRSGWAGFGQVSWRPFPQLELTAGGRYSKEKVEVGGERLRNIFRIENANPTFFEISGEESFDDFSWLGSASYRFARNGQIYATVAKGWKAGGFNRFPSTRGAVLPYDSETSINYEIGLKSGWFNNRLTTNLALFYIDIEDQQLLTVTPDPNGVPVTTIANAGKSRSKGVEVEIFARPVENLNLSFASSYTEGRFKEFLLCASPTRCVDRAGEPFEFTPEWTLSATADYTIPLGDDLGLQLYANYRYIDSILVANGSFLSPLGSQSTIPSYDRMDLRASLLAGNWRVTAYVENVFDSYDYVSFGYQPFLPEAPQNAFVVPLAPRTVGVVVSTRF